MSRSHRMIVIGAAGVVGLGLTAWYAIWAYNQAAGYWQNFPNTTPNHNLWHLMFALFPTSVLTFPFMYVYAAMVEHNQPGDVPSAMGDWFATAAVLNVAIIAALIYGVRRALKSERRHSARPAATEAELLEHPFRR